MKIIIPCCDRICYKKQIPRFLTPCNNSESILHRVINSIGCDNEIIISLYSDHNEKYNISNNFNKLRFCNFEKDCTSQAETITETVKKNKIKGSIFIKDSDSTFEFDVKDEDCGYVCVESLNNFDSINVNDKSYIQVDHNNFILNIREKAVISNLFSVGGYYFPDAEEFVNYYNKLIMNLPQWQSKIFISDIIGMMILNGLEFKVNMVKNYKDYGTAGEWKNIIDAGG